MNVNKDKIYGCELQSEFMINFTSGSDAAIAH